ncbi:MAG: hypothetical protein LBK61_08395 [Spirochaetaceae bacterium]|jgi:hypothetical protein|nr:hypothetical protein [Spirochaetaceae bacterium]
MGDLMKFDGGDSGGMPPSGKLARQGLSAVGFLAAGAGLFVMGALPVVVGIVAGAAACFFGIGSAFSHDKADRLGGSVLFAGGALTLLAKLKIPVLAGLSSVVLSIGAVACIGMGIWNGIKFLRGLKDRG